MLLFLPLFLGFFALGIASLVFWVMKIVEIVGIPDHQFRAAGSEKVAWVLVVVLAGWIGALIWQFAKRDDVLAAAGVTPLAPPGWYPDPNVPGGMRWWDGRQWTAHQSGPPAATG